MATQETPPVPIPQDAQARFGPCDEAAQRAALHAVLASSTFQSKPRLAALLRYICERSFEGGTDAIKEYSIATDVFRRPPSFDQATDSIVRVEVFRLRKKLREFYEGEGALQPLEIVIATGHYRPEFVPRFPDSPAEGDDGSDAAAPRDGRGADGKPEQAGLRGRTRLPITVQPGNPRHWLWAAAGLLVAAGLVAAFLTWHPRFLSASVGAGPQRDSAPAPLPAGPEIRIRCGYSRPAFRDADGNQWSGDRYFTGGFVTELPTQPIARTRNPQLYLAARSGVFSYRIPLAPGSYELRLHFAETTYSPASTLGGGENSRVFDVQLNGRPLLTQFDIVNDAGANTADVRVFPGVSPAADGFLHLDFSGSLGLPLLNAIEILPGLPHRIRPIRMVAQNSFFLDKAGNLWMPDTYVSGGRLAQDKLQVAGAADAGLFAGERYGNFSYALPVAPDGVYKLTLYFSEKYWGGVSRQGGAGSRVFDVLCNGTALARRLDIFKEVGAGNALVKVYRGLRPNAQGKLVVSFVPDVNYASVDALEVEEEQAAGIKE